MIETAYEREKRIRVESEEREKRAEEYRLKMNLPVPVLAEPKDDCAETSLSRVKAPGSIGGEARESTTTPKGVSRRDERNTDSRGGQTPQQKWREKNKEKLAEYMRRYRAQKKLKK